MLPHVDKLVESLKQVDESGVDGVLRDVEDDIASDQTVAFELYKTNLVQEMGGSLFVHDIELDTVARELTERSGDDVPFFRLPFKEAIEHFMRKRLVTYDEFEAMESAQRFRSFSLARATSTAMIAKIKRALDSMMRDQESQATLRDFVTEFEGRAEGFTSNYLENVMRTTTSSSYNSGRKKAQQSTAVVTMLPYWQYATAGDSRVSDYCKPYHLRVWEASKFPQEIYPPNHFQCRSVVVSRTVEQAKRFPSGEDLNVSFEAQDGFNAPPDGVIAEAAA